jgi:hypothetical protein
MFFGWDPAREASMLDSKLEFRHETPSDAADLTAGIELPDGDLIGPVAMPLRNMHEQVAGGADGGAQFVGAILNQDPKWKSRLNDI